MIIDIHAHTSLHKLWDLHAEYATIDVLEGLAIKHGVQKIVLLATYFPLKKRGLSNKELLRRIQGNPLFLAFGSLDMTGDILPGLLELEELIKAGKICGIKLYPGYQNFSPGDKKVFPIYELAKSYDLPVMFHGGELHHCCRESDRVGGVFKCGYDHCRLKDLRRLSQPTEMLPAFKSFPNVNFIVSHLANDSFGELRTAMSQFQNVFTDISGQFVSGKDEASEAYKTLIVSEIKRFLRLKNGMGRVMFGTDFPIQSYEDSIDLVKRLRLSNSDEEKIFFKNAQKILKLKEGK